MEQPDVVVAAEEVLTRRYGGKQQLFDAARLDGSGFAEVYRARVVANPLLQDRSVVIKHSPTTGDPLEDAAFLREVVAYQFTTSLSEEVRPGPVLLGYDETQRIIILSDSGDSDTLQTLLEQSDRETRVMILRNLGASLGRMHAGTAHKETAFNVLFARMTRESEGASAVQDLRDRILSQRIPLGLDMLEQSGIAIPQEVSATASNVSARLLSGGNRAFTPFDLAPDNIIYAEKTQFLDYEWAGFRDVTFDLAFVVAGFPNYVSAHPIDNDEARVFVDAWVREVCELWPAVLIEDTLQARITAALIGWALSSVAVLNVNAQPELGSDFAAGTISDFEVSGDLLRSGALGPFTADEQLVRRDLFETFEALARYAGTGRDPAYKEIAQFARSVASRLS